MLFFPIDLIFILLLEVGGRRILSVLSLNPVSSRKHPDILHHAVQGGEGGKDQKPLLELVNPGDIDDPGEDPDPRVQLAPIVGHKDEAFPSDHKKTSNQRQKVLGEQQDGCPDWKASMDDYENHKKPQTQFVCHRIQDSSQISDLVQSSGGVTVQYVRAHGKRYQNQSYDKA
jgi:hypothetical protein